MTQLTEARIRTATPRDRAYKLFDERGLFLFVTPTGGRLWRFRYRIGPNRWRSSYLGAYPDVTLKRAREKRDEARKLVADEIDPSVERQARRAAQLNTFEAVAAEWLELQKKSLSPETMSILETRLTGALYPYLGSRPIAVITAQEVLAVLRRIEAGSQGRTGACEVTQLRLGDRPRSGRRVDAGDRRLQRAPGDGACAQARTIGLRSPRELRGAEWSEFDLQSAEWRIPGARMKMGEPHIVPLSRQALAIVRELEPFARGGRYLFPSIRTRERPMSENTINAALRRLGYTTEEQTGHGFRSMASTLLNEQGFPPDVIELQLAHTERNKVRAAYNKAQRLAERRKMMQTWADHLDTLRAGADVVPIRRAASAA